MPKTYLLVNPKSGDCEDTVSEVTQALAAAGVDYDARYELGDRSWRETLAKGDRLLLAGGDGSIGAVVGTCIERGATLAVLPLGTANDFARALGVPQTLDAACASLSGAETRTVDVAWIDDRPYLNVAHVGLGAMVNEALDSQAKSTWKRWSYLRALFDRLWKQHAFHGTWCCDDGPSQYGLWLTIAVANGPYFGGGAQIPAAEVALDDRRLTVAAVHARPWYRLLLSLVRLHLYASAKQDENVEYRTCHSVVIETHRSIPVTADGEPRGTTPVRIRLEPGALCVLSPRPLQPSANAATSI